MKTIAVFGVIALIIFGLWKTGLLNKLIDKIKTTVDTFKTEEIIQKDVSFGTDNYVDGNIGSHWGDVEEYKSFDKIKQFELPQTK